MADRGAARRGDAAGRSMWPLLADGSMDGDVLARVRDEHRLSADGRAVSESDAGPHGRAVSRSDLPVGPTRRRAGHLRAAAVRRAADGYFGNTGAVRMGARGPDF